jgi:hypothetical protein
MRVKHGMSGTKVHRAWKHMKGRCLCATDNDYHNYGARGITVCNEWLDFEAFYADMGDPPTEAHTLERLNVNGNYEPSNCCWATRSQQVANRRPHRLNYRNAKHISSHGCGFRVTVTVTRKDKFRGYRRTYSEAEELLSIIKFEQRVMYNLGFQ